MNFDINQIYLEMKSANEVALANWAFAYECAIMPSEVEAPEARKINRKSRYDKKAAKRKESAKRFRDRSRHAQHANHLDKMYDVESKRLAMKKAGIDALHGYHHTHSAPELVQEPDDNEETSTIKCLDGSTISCTMGSKKWCEVWHDFNALGNRLQPYDCHNCEGHVCEIEVSTPEPVAPEPAHQLDYSEFSAQEIAQIVAACASADWVRRMEIREFFGI